jgi:hypothetical protein
MRHPAGNLFGHINIIQKSALLFGSLPCEGEVRRGLTEKWPIEILLRFS